MNDQDFVENVRVEAIENIRRLRHRASLALWCGNNEMEWGWVSWGWDTPVHADLKAAYYHFFFHTLPEWCELEDPDRAYWPSSPSSGVPFDAPNGEKLGDAHYWEVWHGGRPFSAFRVQYPRFMSEFGFQSLPSLETIRTYDDQTKMGMYVTSDLTQRWNGTVHWSLESLTGDVLANGQEEVLATPLATTRIQSLDFAEHTTDNYRRDRVFVCELWQDNQRLTLDVTPFVPNKHLSLTAPELEVDLCVNADQLVFTVTAQSLARFVELSLADAIVVFSDNYFDVPAGRMVTVTCTLPDGWTVEMARRVLKIRSLYDSFA